MIGALRACTALMLWACGVLPASSCTLVLSEHRTGRLLAQLPLDPTRPLTQVAFTHSVLQTPVLDIYRWQPDGQGRWQAQLVEEHFEGQGYGLPHTAAEGERLVRQGNGWRLELSRKVDPLVVRPLPAQRMRLVRPHEPDLLLGTLSTQAIEMQAQGCPEKHR